MTTTNPEKQYIGDSVYADFDGFAIILTTENVENDASNTIVLEPEVVAALQAYIQQLRGNDDNSG